MEPTGGIGFFIGEYFAYYDKSNGQWDYIEQYADKETQYANPYISISDQELGNKQLCENIWNKQKEETKVKLRRYGFISYENIIAIDETGDSKYEMPHIYVEFKKGQKYPPFENFTCILYSVGNIDQPISINIIEDNRIKFFKENEL